MIFIIVLCSAAAAAILIGGIHIIRPAERGLVETLGRATGYIRSGFHWRLPVVQRICRLPFLERRLYLGSLSVMTSDNMTALADAEITIRLKDDKASVQNAFYNTDDVQDSIASLAQTTLLDIIGTMTAPTLVTNRRIISSSLLEALIPLAGMHGVEVLRADLKELEFPKAVRESVQNVFAAQNEKRAAADFAAAAETAAEGMRRADIKKAEGKKQARILAAEGNAEAIRRISEASRRTFISNEQLMSMLVAALTDDPENVTHSLADGAANQAEALPD